MKISVYTPSHNAKWLPSVYESLRLQDHSDWEWLILANNGCSFESNDPRVRVVRDESQTKLVGALKRLACQNCQGDVLLELDHDDALLPGALSEVAAAFSDPTVDFVYSNTINHDIRTNTPLVWDVRYGWQHRPIVYEGMECLESVSSDPHPQSISRIWFAPNHLRAWRTDFYWRVGGHNPEMKICDDHDLICRTYLAGKMVHIDKPLYFYRVHGDNTWLLNMAEIQTTMWGVHDKYIYAMALKWAKTNGLRCLDLCGGIDRAEGFESVDKHDGDVLADLDKPWPFADDSVGVIRAHDAIEHLVNPIHTMNEAWRVLGHGGFFLIQVPSTDGAGAWCDPTHRSFWNARSFRYYTDPRMQRYLGHAGCSCSFQAIKVVNVKRYDDVPYVDAHLVALKQPAPRFYGECLWTM